MGALFAEICIDKPSVLKPRCSALSSSISRALQGAHPPWLSPQLTMNSAQRCPGTNAPCARRAAAAVPLLSSPPALNRPL